jgi:hypothetical protein
MNIALPGNEAGLLGYWDFNEGIGQDVYDKSPNGNHGIIIGDTQWTGDAAPISPFWLSVDPAKDTIPSGSSMDVEAMFDATELLDGHYYAMITISSNDPVNPVTRTPVHMKVGTPVSTDDIPGVSEMQLYCFPNPFSSTTNLSWTLPESCQINLIVFNSHGKIVKELFDGYCPAGRYDFLLNTNDLPAGMYYCRLLTGGKMLVVKMVLLK